MYPETVVEAWESYYKENGLSWLAPQVQAAIKQAFFAGMEAVEHSVQRTCANSSDGEHHYFSNGNQNPNCLYCGTSR